MTTPCPTPTKAAFATEPEVRRQLAKILANPRTIVLPSRVYLCECGAWHLASSPARTITRPTPMLLAHAAAERRAAS